MRSIKRALVFVFLLIMVVTFQNCAPFDEAKFNDASVSGLSYYSNIQQKVFAAKCVDCHSGASPSGGVDLSSYSAILSSGVITLGDALASTLYTAVQNPTSTYHDILDSNELNGLKDWIDDGAKENEVPIVNAGKDKNIVLPTSSTSLSGLASDIDGAVVTYVWSQTSGPNNAIFSNANSAKTNVSNLIQGTYVFKLTVTDDFGATAQDSLNIIVALAANVLPTVNAGADKSITLPTNSITISSSSSDSDGSIASYAWSQVSGPSSANLSGGTTANLVASNLVQGTYVFGIQVTDDRGGTASDSVSVVVNAAPAAAPTYSELNAEIFPSCTICHNPSLFQGNYDMTTYAKAMTSVSVNNASGSELYKRVLDNSMPPGSPLSTADKNRIKDWINAGALNN